MVLQLKLWKSRSSPGFAAGGRGRGVIKTLFSMSSRRTHSHVEQPLPAHAGGGCFYLRTRLPALMIDAGWSSPVARQAHNLKAAGSNPAPATKILP